MMKRLLRLVTFLLMLSMQVPLLAQSKKDKVAETEEVVLPELYVTGNTLYVKNAPVGAKLQIITIVGNKVREIEMHSGNETFELNLPKAIYIFKMEGVVRKFVIR
jgi:hypothetical protein